MSHDIPYGTYFNILVCDRFSVDRSGMTIMRRFAAVEWLKSTWMSRTIESGAKAALEPDAASLAGLLKDRLAVTDSP